MPTGPAPMERMKRTNAVVRNLERQMGPLRRYLYTMDVNRGRNCYNCGEFGHLARNCRNRRNEIGEGRRLEYGQGNNEQSNLNGEGNLIVFN